MKLYEIEEPVAEVAVGIDLGTTNSVIAYKKGSNKPYVISDINGTKILPSVVARMDDRWVVGDEARKVTHFISSVKRLIGKKVQNIQQDQLPFKIICSPNNSEILIDVSGSRISPIEVSSKILESLKLRAIEHLNTTNIKAVITVPAYFDNIARVETKRAAELAGIEVLRLINEPTAAAIAYGLDQKETGIFLVYDLGGGTFDISIVSKKHGLMQVIATAGDVALGGDDFDLALLNLINNKYNLTNEYSSLASLQLKLIRESLSSKDSWSGLFFNFYIEINRDEFEIIISPLLEKTKNLIKKALRDAEIEISEISEIILVGGATRTPSVKKMIENLFNKKPLDNIDPDEIVAIGASIHAYNLLHADGTIDIQDDFLLLDITPLTLSLELMNDIAEPIINRNTSIPISVSKIFTNYSSEQTAIKLNILQGESDKASKCRSIGILELSKLPKMPAGTARIEVSFAIDADGILTVSVLEKNSGIWQKMTLKPIEGLDKESFIKLAQGETSN